MKLFQSLAPFPAWARRHALGLALIINAVLYGLLFIYVYPCFQTNDDIGMTYIVAGMASGTPDAHLIFSNVIIGWVLKTLFTLTLKINWYSVYIILSEIASATVILYLLVRRGPIYALPYLAIFSRFFVHMFAGLQFTLAAGLTGIAGVLLLAEGARVGGRIFNRHALAGMAMVVLSGLIRFPMMGLILAGSAPYLALVMWGDRGRRYAPLAVAVGISLLAVALDQAVYASNASWRYYNEFNAVRGRIYDTPRQTGTQKELVAKLATIGWTEFDKKLFDYAYIFDTKTFTLENLKKFDAAFPGTRETLRESYDMTLSYLKRNELFLGFLIFPMAVLLPHLIFNWRLALALPLVGAALMGLAIYLIHAAKLPDRVIQPMIMLPGMLMAYELAVIQGGGAMARWPRLRRVGALAYAGVMLYACLMTLPEYKTLMRLQAEARNRAGNYEKMVRALAADKVLGRGAVIMVIGGGMAAECQPTYHIPAELARIHFVWGGWGTNSPFFRQRLLAAGIKNITTEIYTNDKVFVAGPYFGRGYINRYISLKYGIPLKADMVTYASPGLSQAQLNFYCQIFKLHL